ncbi:MAG: aldehyde reductase [Thermoanaerobaculia bacterium]|nr:aldehyde reductase [Thermoanaerobaculia bacterium]
MTPSPPDLAATRVLVTGATGFIAQHCILQLLDAGYSVRGSARSASRAERLRDTLRPHLASPDALTGFELVSADLTRDEGWDEAVAGCTYVLHVASPIPRTPPDDEEELIVPARDGVLRVLDASARAGVRRVVLTSSMAAILYGRDRSRVFDESSWSDVESKAIGAYEKSKTLAERAAWDFIDKDASGMELAVINPGLVLGPVLDDDWGTSGEAIKKLFDRDFPAVPDMNWACVDVRDVASAHLAAMTVPEAAGQRFICAEQNHSMREVAEILAREFGPRGFKIPTGRLPGFLVRLAAIFDKTARLGLNDLGVKQQVDTTRIRTVLGWEARGLEEMVVAMGQSFIDHGIVTAG